MKFFLAATAILAAIAHGHEIEKRQTGDSSKKVVCYYTNWSVYRKGVAKYTPQNINPYLCTHLVYAFGGLTDEFEVGPFDTYQDIEQGGYAKFNGLKQYNKGLKTLLAIGGWNEGSGRFSELVSLPEYRKAFILSAIKHLRRYNFDGLDLDWEYPASRDGSAPEDKENYALLVRELRETFDDEGRKVNKGRLLLTMAVPAGQNYIDKGYDIPSLTRDLDFFNILNYDYHSAYEPNVNHHAALMPAPGTSEYEWNAQLNVDWTVKYYIKLGAEIQKLVIGIPTYGRSFTLIDGNFTDFGASADGPGEQGKYTRENGFMAFYEVCENIASHGWDVRKPYPRRIGPYAFSGNQWVGYDDEKIVARKAEYVRENNLGGIMFWSLDNDDFRGVCNGEEYPLIEAGKKALFSGLDTSLNDARNLQTDTTTSGTPTRTSNRLSDRLQNRRRPGQSSTITRTTTPSTTIGTSPSRTGPGGRRRQSQGSRQQQSTTIDPLNTPAPPTTPSPVSSFACKREGFYPNPDNCHKYYWCLDSGASGLGIVAHAFTCPSGLVFNKIIDGCDHADRAKCNTEKKSRGGTAGNTTPGSTTPIPTTTEIPTDYSYYDDYYYDDYEYDQPLADNLPAPVEEVSNNVGRQFQNAGGNQFQLRSKTTEASFDAQDDVSTSRKSSLGGRTRPQYTSISRDGAQAENSPRNAAPTQQQNVPRGSPSRPEYTTIQRQRPATQSVLEDEAALARQTTTGERQYVTIDRRRPGTQTEETIGEDPNVFSSTEPTLEYVTISRNRGSTPPSSDSTTPFSTDLRNRDSTAQSLVDTPSTPRYITLQRSHSPTATTKETINFFEDTTTAMFPIDGETMPTLRIRVPKPIAPQPTAPPSFGRQRTTTRPLLQARPTRPQVDNHRSHPQNLENIPTLSQSDARPTRPLIVPRPRPTPTTVPPVVVEEETVVPPEDEHFKDTTIVPETSEGPTLIEFFPRPQPVTPAQASPTPRPTPSPRLTTQLPVTILRPSPRPRPRPVITTPRPIALTTPQPPARSPRPSRPVPSRAPSLSQSPAPSSILSNDYYDYYYEDLDGALTGTLGQLATLTDKAILMADGSVQCYDTGYFAHPDSCKKFISCSKTVRGLVRGWVYTCPEQLVFDPVGGMCNWAEAVDCAGIE